MHTYMNTLTMQLSIPVVLQAAGHAYIHTYIHTYMHTLTMQLSIPVGNQAARQNDTREVSAFVM